MKVGVTGVSPQALPKMSPLEGTSKLHLEKVCHIIFLGANFQIKVFEFVHFVAIQTPS